MSNVHNATSPQPRESLGLKWLHYWHGAAPEPHQHDYYRCASCRSIVTWKAIKAGGCRCHGGNRLSPAELSWAKKVQLFLWPWWGCKR